eukprot:GFKZ01008435.1.p1 GENE.GFKZ01008435.1~~GFKZ01008435.1.p1  ORF type:complete len:152 (+),score=20.66 GFKZ01008435.1:135-590(+)
MDGKANPAQRLGGMATTLQAKCFVLAVACVEQGRHDSFMSFCRRLRELHGADVFAFGRFPCGVRDSMHSTQDEALAQFVGTAVLAKRPDMDDERMSPLCIELGKLGSGGVPIALGYLESVVRLATARGRQYRRELVRKEGINAAVAKMESR